MSYSYNDGNMTMSMPMRDMGMHMGFYWGKDVVVLFSGWPGNGRAGMYALAVAAVFLIAVATELLSRAPNFKPRSMSPFASAGINAAVYAVRMALAYLVMLSVMSFNGGIFLAAVAGHAVGRFMVRYREMAAVARAVES